MEVWSPGSSHQKLQDPFSLLATRQEQERCWNEGLCGVQNKSLRRLISREAGKLARNAILELNDLTGNYSPRSSFLLETLGQSLKKLAIKEGREKGKVSRLNIIFFYSESFIVMKLVGKGGVILLAL